MKRIISTKFPNLVRFIFPELRQETSLPIVGGFFLQKNLTYREKKYLREAELSNYVIVSESHFEEQWDRQEIVDFVVEKIKSRRKPDFSWMNDDQFNEAVKALYADGSWPDESVSDSVFDLFKNLTGYKRVPIYFNLLKSNHPLTIFYSVLTFVQRCHDPESLGEVSSYYRRVIKSQTPVVKKNFNAAIRRYSDLDTSQEFRVLAFIETIGRRDGTPSS